MIAPCFRRIFGGCLLALAFLSPQQISAQGAAFVYISNVIGTESGGIAAEFVPERDPPARATVRAPLMNVVFSTEIQCVAVSSPDRGVVRPEGQARSMRST